MTSALRHACVSKSTGLPRVKPDQWGPLVSDWGLVSAADVWAQSTATSARSKQTRGATAIRLNLIYFS